MFVAGAAQTVGPQALQTYLNIDAYFKRRAASLGISIEGLIKTEEQIQEEQQQAQQMALAQQLGPNAINAMSQDNVARIQQEGQEIEESESE